MLMHRNSAKTGSEHSRKSMELRTKAAKEEADRNRAANLNREVVAHKLAIEQLITASVREGRFSCQYAIDNSTGAQTELNLVGVWLQENGYEVTREIGHHIRAVRDEVGMRDQQYDNITIYWGD